MAFSIGSLRTALRRGWSVSLVAIVIAVAFGHAHVPPRSFSGWSFLVEGVVFVPLALGERLVGVGIVLHALGNLGGARN